MDVLMRLSDAKPLRLQVFLDADLIWIGPIAPSHILTFLLRETGAALLTAPVRS
jgi:hypothetical protein